MRERLVIKRVMNWPVCEEVKVRRLLNLNRPVKWLRKLIP